MKSESKGSYWKSNNIRIGKDKAMKKWRVGVTLACVTTLLLGMTSYAAGPAGQANDSRQSGVQKSETNDSGYWSLGGTVIVSNGQLTDDGIQEGVSYDSATDTLTLTNFQGSFDAENGALRAGGENATLKLEGRNKITLRDTYYAQNQAIVSSAEQLTIAGTGTLDLDISNTKTQAGIYYQRDLTIRDCTLNVTRNDNYSFYGITAMPWTTENHLTIQNARVNVSGTIANSEMVNVGIDAQDGDMTVINSEVNINLSGGEQAIGIGVGLWDGYQVQGGKLTVENSKIESAVSGYQSDFFTHSMYFYDLDTKGTAYYYAGDTKADTPMTFEKAFEYYDTFINNRYDTPYNCVTISSRPLGEFCDHQWEEGEVKKEPDCTTAGEREYNCPVCGETKTEEIPAYGHEWGEWKVTKEATCTQDGEQVRTCTRCGEEEKGVAEKLGHDIATETVPATCTEDGRKTEKCSRCDYEKTEVIGATGHEYEWTVEKEATFHEDGVKKGICKNCGDVITERIPMLSESHEHSFSGKEEIVKEATCTETGSRKIYCTEPECGEFITETIPVKEHTAGEWVTVKEASCTETGTEQTSCTVCETILETKTIEKLAHTCETWEEVTAATCTAAGEEKAVCTVCGETVTRETGVLGHDFAEWKVEKEATCTEDGEEFSVCSRCDETSTRKTEAVGHQFGEWEVTVEPTFTSEGERQKVCSECGETLKEKLPKLSDVQPAVPGEGSGNSGNGAGTQDVTDSAESGVPKTADTASFGWILVMAGALACIAAVKKRRVF